MYFMRVMRARIGAINPHPKQKHDNGLEQIYEKTLQSDTRQGRAPRDQKTSAVKRYSTRNGPSPWSKRSGWVISTPKARDYNGYFGEGILNKLRILCDGLNVCAQHGSVGKYLAKCIFVPFV